LSTGKPKNFNGSIRSDSCYASCRHLNMSTTLPIPYYNDTIDVTDPALTPNCSETENNYKDLPGIVVNQTHEQTFRLMQNHYGVILNGKKTPTVNITEYEYFQSARLLFLKLCPESEVPPDLVTDLLRMFRVMVNESQNKYPYRQMGDYNEDDRIKEGLATCLSGANQKIEFVYNDTVCPHEVELT